MRGSRALASRATWAVAAVGSSVASTWMKNHRSKPERVTTSIATVHHAPITMQNLRNTLADSASR